MRAAAILLAAGSWLWLALMVAAPSLLRPAGQFICHQRPERSFVVRGEQMPVCARCTGLYAGAAAAAPLALLALAPLARRRARRLLILAALPTAITWTLEFAGIVPFSNLARFLAALPLGFAASWLVIHACRDADVSRRQAVE